MSPSDNNCGCPHSRRRFLETNAFGIGGFALATLLRQDGLLARPPEKPADHAPNDLKWREPRFAPKANAMISMFMHGGPAHMDLLDPKPELTKHHGQEYSGDVVFSFVNRASKKLFGSPWKFESTALAGPRSQNCCRTSPGSSTISA